MSSTKRKTGFNDHSQQPDNDSPYQEPGLADKVKINSTLDSQKSGKNNVDIQHVGEFSSLKATANLGDFRLSDFNLERIHRFVDEPQRKIGTNMKQVLENVDRTHQNTAMRKVISPFVESDNQHAGFTHGKNLGSPSTAAATTKNKHSSILEHNDKLGTRSRYGDGDGTFWGRWIGQTGVKTTEGYKSMPFPSESSFQQGSTVPRSGFKRFSQNHDLHPSNIDTGNDRRIRQYSLYGKQGDGTNNSPTGAGAGGRLPASQSSPTLYSRQQIIKRPSVKDTKAYKQVADHLDNMTDFESQDESDNDRHHQLSHYNLASLGLDTSDDDEEEDDMDRDGPQSYGRKSPLASDPLDIIEARQANFKSMGKSNASLMMNGQEDTRTLGRSRAKGMVQHKKAVDPRVLENYFGGYLAGGDDYGKVSE